MHLKFSWLIITEGNPLGHLHFRNTDGAIHYLCTRHMLRGSNLANGEAGLSKSVGVIAAGIM